MSGSRTATAGPRRNDRPVLEQVELKRAFQAGDRVLCLACGSRLLARLVQEAGAVPYGVEPDPMEAERARLAGCTVFAGPPDQFFGERPPGRPEEFQFAAAVISRALAAAAPGGWESLQRQAGFRLAPGGRLLCLEPDGRLTRRRETIGVQVALPPIVYTSAIYNASGYAIESRAFIRELVGRGHQVQVVHMGARQPGALSAAEEAFWHRLEAVRVDPAQAIQITALPPIAAAAPTAAYTVLRSMFETDRIPAEWADNCNQFDAVWVPAEHSRRAFAASGVSENKLRVVRGGVDTALFRPEAAPLPLPRRRGFRFLSVFDWHFRKGWDLLLAAYVQEFAPEEDVVLYLKVNQLSKLTAVNAEICFYLEQVLGKAPEQVPELVLLPFDLPEAEMPGLYTAVDAFVLPSRGEGYGRPFLEAMACGLPVIGTAWGGQTDFLTEANSCPLPSLGLEPVPDYEPVEVYAGLTWARPSLPDLRRLMRRLQSQPAAGRALGAVAQQDVATSWDVRVAADQLERELTLIARSG